MWTNARSGAREHQNLRVVPLVLLALSALLALPWPVHAQSNSLPVFPSATTVRSIPETLPAPSPVGAPVVAAGSDNGTLTYSLSGADAALFDVVRASGQLETREPLDYEAQSNYTVIVRATDLRGLFDTISVNIDVSNVDEAGEVILEGATLGGDSVIDALLVDPDGDLSAVSWQWASSPDKTAWTDIEGAVLASYAPKPGDLRQFLRVRATYVDGHGPGKTAATVVDPHILPSTANYPPEFPFSESGVRSVSANAFAGEQVGGPVLASDLDGDVLTYLLSGDVSDFFEIGPHSGQIETIGPLNNQLEGRYFGVVHVFDGKGGNSSIAVGIDVGNVRPAAVLDSTPAAGPEVGTIPVPAPSSVADQVSSLGPATSSTALQAVEPQEPLTARDTPSQQFSEVEARPAMTEVAAGIPTSEPASDSWWTSKPRSGVEPSAQSGKTAVPPLAAINSPPSSLPAIVAQSINPSPSHGKGTEEAKVSGWLRTFPIWIIGFVLGALLVTGIAFILRTKRNQERKTTLPPPTIGPERRIFPHRTFFSSSNEKKIIP